MDDKTFEIKNVEFHLKQISSKYEECVSKVLKEFLETNEDFTKLSKKCENLRTNLADLFNKYEELNKEI